MCAFTCLNTGGLRFHQNAKHSGLEGPQEFKYALYDYTALKTTPSENTESERMVFLTIIIKELSYIVKSASFH